MENETAKNSGEAAKESVYAPSSEDPETALKYAVVDKIVDESDILVPEEEAAAEVEIICNGLRSKLRYENMLKEGGSGLLSDYANLENSLKQIKEAAYRQVKTRLVLDSVIKSECIEVSGDELRREALAIAERQGAPPEMVNSFYGDDFGLIKQDLLIKKAIDFIYKNAQKLD